MKGGRGLTNVTGYVVGSILPPVRGLVLFLPSHPREAFGSGEASPPGRLGASCERYRVSLDAWAR